MSTKRKGGLLLTSIIVQVIALISAICLNVMQSPIKEALGAREEVVQTEVIPENLYVQIISLLLVYITGLLIIRNVNSDSTKTAAIIFVVIACVFQIAMPFISNLLLIGMSKGDVNMLTSYNMIDSASEFCVTPFTIVALALFCMGCGRYWGIKEVSD